MQSRRNIANRRELHKRRAQSYISNAQNFIEKANKMKKTLKMKWNLWQRDRTSNSKSQSSVNLNGSNAESDNDELTRRLNALKTPPSSPTLSPNIPQKIEQIPNLDQLGSLYNEGQYPETPISNSDDSSEEEEDPRNRKRKSQNYKLQSDPSENGDSVSSSSFSRSSSTTSSTSQAPDNNTLLISKMTTPNIDILKKNLEAKNIYIDDIQNIRKIYPEFAEFIQKENGTNGYYINTYGNVGVDIKTQDQLWFMMQNVIYYGLKFVYENTQSLIFYMQEIYKVQYSYQELLLNVLFILLLFIIVFIMYWDYVYRASSKASRCTKIREIIDDNEKADYPYIYVVYIVHEENASEVLDKYAIKLEYNFFKKTTKIAYGNREYYNDVILEMNNESNESNDSNDVNMQKAFTYFDLDDMIYKTVEKADDNYGLVRIDSSVITTKKYRYIVMTPTFKVRNDEASYELAKFVRQYGRDKNMTKLYPIYNILNAVDQQNITSY